MRLVVCMKRVVDPSSVKISRSREELDLREAAEITNPPDRVALEVALRLREALGGGEVVALTLDQADKDDVAREAVAIGADRAVLVHGGPEPIPTGGAAVTRALAAALARLAPVDFVFTGQIGATDGTGGLAGRLAAALDWPLLLDVVSVESGEAGLDVVFESGAAGQRLALAGPAVLEVGSRGPHPRYARPARIANAWQPGMVEFWPVGDLGLAAAELVVDTEEGGLVLGPERVRGQHLAGSVAETAAALAALLRQRRIV